MPGQEKTSAPHRQGLAANATFTAKVAEWSITQRTRECLQTTLHALREGTKQE